MCGYNVCFVFVSTPWTLISILARYRNSLEPLMLIQLWLWKAVIFNTNHLLHLEQLNLTRFWFVANYLRSPSSCPSLLKRCLAIGIIYIYTNSVSEQRPTFSREQPTHNCRPQGGVSDLLNNLWDPLVPVLATNLRMETGVPSIALKSQQQAAVALR